MLGVSRWGARPSFTCSRDLLRESVADQTVVSSLLPHCRCRVGLAYTWPTYMTFKAVTLSDHDATRQWCIYWIILGLFLSLEWITDILLWWLPLYHEGKLLCLVLM